MTTKIEFPAAGAEISDSDDGEPPQSCADISVDDDRWVSVSGLQELAASLVIEALLEAGLPPDKHCVSIALLSASEVRSLNKAFRGKDAATNVLSFPPAPSIHALKHQRVPIFLGDIALAYEAVVEEALSQEKPVLHHAAHLVVHGVLHLAGFDHEAEVEAERMEAAERVILGRFGIPDPYRDNLLPLATAV